MNILNAARDSEPGVYLRDEEGEEILLPNKYVPSPLDQYADIEVFVYRDTEDRLIATTLKPKIMLDEFACLEVKDVNRFGAFLDWGLEGKDLLLPFSNQPKGVKLGQHVVVRLILDPITERLVATAKVDKYLKNITLDVEEGEEVDLMMLGITDLGRNVIINSKHKGLLYKSDIYAPINYGDTVKGYIKTIRFDNKIDVSLRKQGFMEVVVGDREMILNAIEKNGGFLGLTDKSSPEEINQMLGMSKKAFKKALGGLYKERLVILEEKGVKLQIVE